MKILMLTDDRVGPVMAGSALRAWEMAKSLTAGGHVVCLAAAERSERPEKGGPELVDRPPWRWAEALITPAWCLPPRALLGRRLLIIDGTTPLLAELAAMPSTAEIRRRRRTAAARLPLVVDRADAVLVAGRAQREWWRHHVAGRRPELPIVSFPFGIPAHDPPPERDEVEGIPRHWAIVLWWGGVWPWLDLETLLAARARLGDVPLSIVVPTARRPGSSAHHFPVSELQWLMRKHGLKAPEVHALERWIPYHERHRILHRTSLIAVLHHPGPEATLAFRTRALDGLWAGVPLLLTEGGEVSRLTVERAWGGVVPAHDPRATAAALELMLSEREQLRCRANLESSRGAWRWSELATPLLEALPSLPATPRGSLVRAIGAAAGSLLVPGAGETT